MNVCRTCLSEENLLFIFEKEKHINRRSDELFLVTGVKINFNDGLSQLICNTCTVLINNALKLRKQSSDAERKLLDICNTNVMEEKFKTVPSKNSTITIADLESSDSSDGTFSPITTKDLDFDSDEGIHKKRLTIDDLESNGSSSPRTTSMCKSEKSQFENIVQIELEPIKVPIKKVTETAKEKKYTIKDLESSDDDVKLDDKEFTFESDSQWKESFLEKMHKQREIKMTSVRAETRKCMALAVQPYDKNGPIKCSLCNKMLKNSRIFKCHAKTHFEPEFSCEICGKKFVFHSVLRYHQQRVHGKQKRLACSQCSYRAVDPQQLLNHTRAAHTGERPFVCDVCGDTFRMRNTIAQHMRKHFGVRNVQCERCPAMFRSGSELSWHRNKVHLMVYTFYCYVCPQTYRRQESVKKHLLKVHGVPLGQHLPIKRTKEMR